jgi:hypothetical protein
MLSATERLAHSCKDVRWTENREEISETSARNTIIRQAYDTTHIAILEEVGKVSGALRQEVERNSEEYILDLYRGQSLDTTIACITDLNRDHIITNEERRVLFGAISARHVHR